MSRGSPISTFLGYYKITATGIFNVLGRSAVEVPSTKVSKGPVTAVTAAALAAGISAIVANNQLIPVTAINEDIETNVLGYLTTSAADAADGGSNSIKFGLMIPEVGPNKGKGVLIVTSKVSGVKTILEIPIEASGV